MITVIPFVRLDIDKEFTAGRLAFLLGLLVLALFPEIMLGSHAFFYRDAGLFTYPVAYYYRDCFWRGEIPLWNPYSVCGIPFLAQWNTMVCYPLNLFFLLVPMPWGLNYFMLGHLFLAAIGMYCLAHRWFGNRFAASVAGLAFAWNGLLLHQLASASNLAALAWMPWVVLQCERAGREGGRRSIIAIFCGAAQMMTGAPEIVLLTWLIVLTRTLLENGTSRRHLFLSLRRLGVVVLLVAGLSAVQLWPWADLVQHGDRSHAYDTGRWSLPPWGAANFLVPLFRATQSVTGVFTQPEQEWTSSYYAGISIVLLGLIGALKVRSRTTRLLGAMVLLGLLCSLGDAGVVLRFSRSIFPLLGFMRYPIKFICVVIFALPLLAAAGMVWLQAAPWGKARRVLIVTGVMIFIGIAGLLLAAYHFPFAQEGWRDTWWNGLGRLIFLAIAFMIFFDQPKARTKAVKIFLSFAFLAALGLDVMSHAPRQNPVLITRGYEPYRLAMDGRPRLGESRALVSREVAAAMGSMFHPYPLNMYLGQRAVLLENCNLLEKIPKVDGFFSLHLREQQEVQNLIYQGSVSPALADFLGASQIATYEHLFHWDARTNFMPIATIGQQPVFADDKATLSALASPDFQPREQVFLPEETHREISAVSDPEAKILSSETAAQECDYITRSEKRTMLVVAQSYYHPWKAYLDGLPVPLLRANHAFQAVEIPAGRHEVRLAYEDQSFRIGLIISSVAALVLFIWFFSCRADARRIELDRSLKFRS